MTPDFALQLVIGLFSAGAVYGGIRMDLRSMKDQIRSASEEARRANSRLDVHIDRRATQ